MCVEGSTSGPAEHRRRCLTVTRSGNPGEADSQRAPDLEGWDFVSHDIDTSDRPFRLVQSMHARFGEHLGLSPLTIGNAESLRQSIRSVDAALVLFDEPALLFRKALRGRHACPSAAVIVRGTGAALDGHYGTRRLLRWALEAFDWLFVYSPDQVGPLQDALRRTTVASVPFGIDTTSWKSTVPATGVRKVVAAGRDHGRDYGTFLAAMETPILDAEVRVLCRPFNLDGLRVPEHVEVVGFLPLQEYRRELDGATVAVVPTKVLRYPTGQTVVLHALALGTPCIVTASPAMESFLGPEAPVVTVPPEDPVALREAIDSLLGDPARRHDLARRGRKFVEDHHDWTHTYAAMLSRLGLVTDA